MVHFPLGKIVNSQVSFSNYRISSIMESFQLGETAANTRVGIRSDDNQVIEARRVGDKQW